MKPLVNLFIIALFFFACTQNKSPENTKETTEIEDTLTVKTITLQVNGMTCEGCETTIAKTVEKIAGVSFVSASHLDSIAKISFDTSKTNVMQISESINKLGYAVVGELNSESIE